MASVASSQPLSLTDLRKEQRRLAVLLNRHDKAFNIPKSQKYPLHDVPPFWAWCSHSDPDGKYRNPALDYLRQGMKHLKNRSLLELAETMANKKRIVLSARGDGESSDFGETDSGYGHTVDALVTSRRHGNGGLGGKQASSSRLRISQNGTGASLFYGKGKFKKNIMTKDIENFAYSNLKRPISLTEDELDDELRELGLSELRGHKGQNGKQAAGFKDGFPFFVPENTPIPTTAASRATGVTLPSIHKGSKGGMVNQGTSRDLLVPDNSFVGVPVSRRGSYPDSDGHSITKADAAMLDTRSSRSDRQNHDKTRSYKRSQNQGINRGHSGEAGYCSCSSVTLPAITKTNTLESPPEDPLMTNDRIVTSSKQRCAKCGGLTDFNSEESAIDYKGSDNQLHIFGSRQNTKMSTREKSMLSTRDTSDFSRRRRDRTDLSSPFIRIRSTTDLSDDSISMEEIRSRLQDIQEKKGPQYRLPSEDRLASHSVKWDERKQEQFYHSSDPPSYMNKLEEIENRMAEGAFDFNSDLDVNNINTQIHITNTPEKEPILKHTHQAKHLKRGKQGTFYKNGYREAYDKALSMAAASRLPSEPWMYSTRISQPFTFSYFENIPKKACCADCPMPLGKSEKLDPSIKKKGPKPKKVEPKAKIPRINEMKHIFGNIDVNDYYPGGKMNLFPNSSHED